MPFVRTHRGLVGSVMFLAFVAVPEALAAWWQLVSSRPLLPTVRDLLESAGLSQRLASGLASPWPYLFLLNAIAIGILVMFWVGGAPATTIPIETDSEVQIQNAPASAGATPPDPIGDTPSRVIDLHYNDDAGRLRAIGDFSDLLDALRLEVTENESQAGHDVYSLCRTVLDKALLYIDEPALLTAALHDALLRLGQATKRNQDYDQRLRQDNGTQETLAQEYRTASSTLNAAVSRYRTVMQSYRLLNVVGDTRQYACNVPGCSTGAFGDSNIQDHTIRVHHVTAT